MANIQELAATWLVVGFFWSWCNIVAPFEGGVALGNIMIFVGVFVTVLVVAVFR